MSGYKRCKCRVDGKELGAACPKLHRGGDANSWNPYHGTWYGKTDIPGLPASAKRMTLRAGGFATKEEMDAWFAAALALLAVPAAGPDGYAARAEILGLITEARKCHEALPAYEDIRRRYHEGAAFRPGSTGEYLISWLASSQDEWSASTCHGYERAVRKIFLPALADIPLDRLQPRHILAVFADIDAESERIRAAKASPDPGVRASVRGRVPTGTSSKRRYLAVIRSALAAAMAPQLRLITANAAAGIKFGKGGRKVIVKAKLWTAAREQAWREDYEARLLAAGNPGHVEAFQIWRNTAARPGPVMVWLPGHLGRFLDAAEDDRLYGLFLVTAHCGLRRGEAAGLKRADTDLAGSAITISHQITQAGYKAVDGKPKDDSTGTVRLDDLSVAALRDERKRQLAERIAWGPAYQETGLTFTREDGSAYHPEYVSYRFERIAFDTGLPPVSFHGLRHGAAVLALAAGTDIKVISAMLRHSSVQITADIYADVTPELAAQTAAKVASMVPRKGRRNEAV